jgi:hypothetical protein
VGLKDKLKRLEGKNLREEVVLVTEDGEEVRFRADPLGLVTEEWQAHRDGRPVDHMLVPYLERGLRLKHPKRVTDPLWKTLDGGDREEASWA